MRSRMLTLATAGAMIVALGGCDDEANVVGPQNEPEVTNVADSFEWQVSDLSAVSQTLTYTWNNTGATADVNQTASLSEGSATLTLTDAQGVQVYARSLTDNGTFQTDAGTAGDWTVSVTLSEASGSLNFRLENPDASP